MALVSSHDRAAILRFCEESLFAPAGALVRLLTVEDSPKSYPPTERLFTGRREHQRPFVMATRLRGCILSNPKGFAGRRGCSLLSDSRDSTTGNHKAYN